MTAPLEAFARSHPHEYCARHGVHVPRHGKSPSTCGWCLLEEGAIRDGVEWVEPPWMLPPRAQKAPPEMPS